MKNLELLEKAEKKAKGLRELGRLMEWHHGAIAYAKKTGKLPPERAIELAEYVGASKEIAYLEALRAQEISEKERAVLGKLLGGFKAGAAALTIVLALAVSAFTSKKAYAGNGIGERHVIYNVYNYNIEVKPGGRNSSVKMHLAHSSDIGILHELTRRNSRALQK